MFLDTLSPQKIPVGSGRLGTNGQSRRRNLQ